MVLDKYKPLVLPRIDAKLIELASRALFYIDQEFAAIVDRIDVPVTIEPITELAGFLRQLCEGSQMDFVSQASGRRVDTRFRKLVRDFLVIRSKIQPRDSSVYYDSKTNTVSFPDSSLQECCPLLTTLKELRFLLDGKASNLAKE